MNRNYVLAFLMATTLIFSFMMTIPITVTAPPGDISEALADPNPVKYTEITVITALIEPEPLNQQIPDKCEFFVETLHAIPPAPAEYGTGYPMCDPWYFSVPKKWISDGPLDTKVLAGPGTYRIWVHAHIMPADEWRDPFEFDLVVNPAPPPKVLNTDPMDDEGNVPTTATIEVQFSNQMDKTSTEAAFSIIPTAPGTFSWPDNYTMVLTPFVPLAEFTDYNVTIDASAQDILGQTLDGDGDGAEEGSPIDDYVFNFTTGITPPSIPLTEGWNLISVPYLQPSTLLEDVLSSISGLYDIVGLYGASDPKDPWKLYAEAKPPVLNDLTHVNHMVGFYIHITEPGGCDLYINGVPPSSQTDIPLYPGWNMVGYPCTVNKTRTAALNNLVYGVNITSMYYFNTSQGRLVELKNPTDTVTVGYGYWMYATKQDVWKVQPN